MTPSLKISQKVIDRLSQQKCVIGLGKIYGIVSENNLTILEVQVADDTKYNTFLNSLPAELYLCGIINIQIIQNESDYQEETIKEALAEVYVTDNPVYIDFDFSSQQITANFYINGQMEVTEFAPVSEQQILSDCLYVRLTGGLPLTCEPSIVSIKESFTHLRKSITSGRITFGLDKKNIYLFGGDVDNGVVGVAGNATVGELWDESSDTSEGGGRKKKVQHHSIDVMKMNMLKKVTIDNGCTGKKEHAPLCVLDKKQYKTVNVSIPIDALAVVYRQTRIANLYEILVESAVRNLKLLERTILNGLLRLECQVSQPEIFHFYPEECGHFFTKIYLRVDGDESLEPERKQFHEELLLSKDRPVFRRSNRYIFKSKNQVNEPLINPHIGVKPPNNGGRVSLVKGRYRYYHYCQDEMDDNGWGCAYRSLQTLASWFKLQGYIEKDVPTFNEIQKCLVDVGDKPANFVGSKQWIGSTEVNFVLNSLLNVTCKILYVSSGDEMASKGPELFDHFEKNGSPVMIGGGVLAHTILGISYNSQSGNIMFLILDPHYTGSEDLRTIQSKGWCGWKNVHFWDKTAYYNMCLPQVSKCI